MDKKYKKLQNLRTNLPEYDPADRFGCAFDLVLVFQWDFICYLCLSLSLITNFAYASYGCSSMTMHM